MNKIKINNTLLQVCCPRKPIYTPQKFNEYGEHYFACDKQDPQPCPIGTKCVLGKECGVKGMYVCTVEWPMLWRITINS